ncbi:hypothetical protein ONE63_002475 [Megalurothrips usitatus]|uniref:snRNA-activating protein complex subunit 3 n=1 Tax=Megalurothrips usitatus TaxID=439358 RepID=A0AAV7XEE0_9NEOP|nr:hypothetical protein ONE63_002475 [Megalurothrips usitatus]
MEKIYRCGELDYTSDLICLRDFFNDASLQHHPLVTGCMDSEGNKLPDNVCREKMMNTMGSALTDSEFSDLEAICSADHFKIPDSQQVQFDFEQQHSMYVKAKIPTDSEFETHKKIKSRGRIHERHLKYTGTVWLVTKKNSGKNSDDTVLTPGSALLVVVRVYAPFRHNIGKRNHRIAVGCQEILVLGSQTLADLRDSFSCSADNIICQDLSSNPFSKSKELAKDKYKSGLFYLEQKFYDDMRHESNIEYSEQILKWAKEKHLNLGGRARMEDTRIIDLTVKLGYPYLYQHQGNCEHLFCFSDVRLIHQSDVLKMSRYPLLRSLSRQHSRYCMLCGHYLAKWVTVGNARVPHDPCYFCQACFISYNYINKRKIGDFAAYPFSDTAPEFFVERK